MSGACFSLELHVEVLRDAAALERIVPQWEDLATTALEANPFYEHWMALPALECLGHRQIEFVAVWRAGRLGALFPLQRAARYRGLPLSALTSWRPTYSLLCTPLVRAEGAAQWLGTFLAWAQSASGAHMLELDYLPVGGPVHCALLDALGAADLHAAPLYAYTRALLRKAENAEACIARAVSHDTRRKLARKERRLAEQGALRRVALAPGGDAARWAEAFLDLEASGWKGERGSAFGSTPEGRRFARSVLCEAHRRGRLLLLGLDLDGKAIGRNCTLLAGGGAFAFRTAYDEAFAAWSPGVLAELDRIGAFHDLPGVCWIDSFTGPVNPRLDAMWKDRMAVQRLAIALGARGELALGALGLARWTRRRLRRAA